MPRSAVCYATRSAARLPVVTVIYRLRLHLLPVGSAVLVTTRLPAVTGWFLPFGWVVTDSAAVPITTLVPHGCGYCRGYTVGCGYLCAVHGSGYCVYGSYAVTGSRLRMRLRLVTVCRSPVTVIHAFCGCRYCRYGSRFTLRAALPHFTFPALLDYGCYRLHRLRLPRTVTITACTTVHVAVCGCVRLHLYLYFTLHTLPVTAVGLLPRHTFTVICVLRLRFTRTFCLLHTTLPLRLRCRGSGCYAAVVAVTGYLRLPARFLRCTHTHTAAVGSPFYATLPYGYVCGCGCAVATRLLPAVYRLVLYMVLRLHTAGGSGYGYCGCCWLLPRLRLRSVTAYRWVLIPQFTVTYYLYTGWVTGYAPPATVMRSGYTHCVTFCHCHGLVLPVHGYRLLRCRLLRTRSLPHYTRVTHRCRTAVTAYLVAVTVTVHHRTPLCLYHGLLRFAHRLHTFTVAHAPARTRLPADRSTRCTHCRLPPRYWLLHTPAAFLRFFGWLPPLLRAVGLRYYTIAFGSGHRILPLPLRFAVGLLHLLTLPVTVYTHTFATVCRARATRTVAHTGLPFGLYTTPSHLPLRLQLRCHLLVYAHYTWLVCRTHHFSPPFTVTFTYAILPFYTPRCHTVQFVWLHHWFCRTRCCWLLLLRFTHLRFITVCVTLLRLLRGWFGFCGCYRYCLYAHAVGSTTHSCYGSATVHARLPLRYATFCLLRFICGWMRLLRLRAFLDFTVLTLQVTTYLVCAFARTSFTTVRGLGWIHLLRLHVFIRSACPLRTVTARSWLIYTCRLPRLQFYHTCHHVRFTRLGCTYYHRLHFILDYLVHVLPPDVTYGSARLHRSGYLLRFTV